MQQKNEQVGMILGFFLLAGMHILAATLIFGILLFISMVQTPISTDYKWLPLILFPSLGIGLFQLIYVIPVVLWLRNKEYWGMMKGVIIGAVVTAFLNGGCWLLLLASMP